MPRCALIHVMTLLVLGLAALLPAGAGVTGPSSPPSRGWGEAATGELRAFWVDAFHNGIKTPAQISQLIVDAHTANVNALIVQVRRRGDSYYNESVEPRAPDIPDPSFDPLASVIAAAHSADPPLQVYAWVVTFPVWTSTYSTTDPTRHVYYRHGCGNGCTWDDPDNWLSYQYNAGNPTPTYDLDPGHPAAARYTVDVCLHLVRHYDVDGLILDYVRYTGQQYGYNKVSEDRFNAAYGGAGHPLPTDPNWSNWRREQVGNVVRRIYLEALAVKPDLVVGAATIAWGDGPDSTIPSGWENTSAYKSVFQDWHGWLQQGILDLAMPMNYDREWKADEQSYFRQWIEWEKDHQYNRGVVVAQAAYLNYITGTLTQTVEVRLPSAAGHNVLGISFYSYTSTNYAEPPNPPKPNSEFYYALSHPTYGEPPFPTPVDPPALSWKTTPTAGHLAGWAIGSGGPLDRAAVQVSGPVSVTLLTDGNGFFGATDLPPGSYTITLPLTATSPLYATVTAGRVALATVSPPPAEAALRAVLVDAAHDGFKTPDQVDVLLADARAAHLNAVIVQMRSDGQIYYNSPLEPRIADPELPSSFDPLAYLLQQAHAGDQPIAVYAWMPALAVWHGDLGQLPAGHVLTSHPDWLTEDITGTQPADGAYFLDPGHPGVLSYTVGLALDLVSRYTVDGLILDSMYYPSVSSEIGYNVWGYNPTSIQRFHASYGGSGDPAPDDPTWTGWRREQLTALLRQAYLRCTELRPHLRIAVVGIAWGDGPDFAGGWENSSAYGLLLQDWRGWLQEGIVDLAAPMNYDREYHSDQRVWYNHWLVWEESQTYNRGVLVLQAAYLNYPEHTLVQAQAGLAPSNAVGFASYIPADLYADPLGNSLWVQPPRQPWYYSPEAEWWLWRSLVLPYGYADPADGSFYATSPIFPGAVPTPTLAWKDTPTLGHAVGRAVGPGQIPFTVPVTITLNGPTTRVLHNDGSGFFGAVDLPPGNYWANVAGADPSYRVLKGTVIAGHVTWLLPYSTYLPLVVKGW